MRTKIIYEDKLILVCYKPAGLPTQTSGIMAQDMVSELKNYLSKAEGKGMGEPYLGLVHRLDQPVEGLLVFGKTRRAAAALSAQLGNSTLHKSYLAVVQGVPEKKEGILTDYLLKEKRDNSSRVVPKGTSEAKRAELFYQVLGTKPDGMDAQDKNSCALVKIDLKTGRHHQIRVQMAHMGCPLVGDRKYGNSSQTVRNPALCAVGLELVHPQTGKAVEFEIKPEGEAFAAFADFL